MRTVTIGVSSLDDVRRDMAAAFNGEARGCHISFATPSLLWQVLTEQRWELLRRMSGSGPMSVDEVAAQAGRNRDEVQADVEALLKAGVLDRPDDGRVEFPYDAIHVDFTVTKAA